MSLKSARTVDRGAGHCVAILVPLSDDGLDAVELVTGLRVADNFAKFPGGLKVGSRKVSRILRVERRN